MIFTQKWQYSIISIQNYIKICELMERVKQINVKYICCTFQEVQISANDKKSTVNSFLIFYQSHTNTLLWKRNTVINDLQREIRNANLVKFCRMLLKGILLYNNEHPHAVVHTNKNTKKTKCKVLSPTIQFWIHSTQLAFLVPL